MRLSKEELFEEVCKSRYFLDDFTKNSIRPLYEDALEYLQLNDLKDSVIFSHKCVALIGQYIIDMRDANAGEGKVSESVNKKILQYYYLNGGEDNESK